MLICVVRVADRDPRLARRYGAVAVVVDQDLVAQPADPAALDDLAAGDAALDGVPAEVECGVAVAEPTQHVGTADVAELEPDEDFVTDLGHQRRARMSRRGRA